MHGDGQEVTMLPQLDTDDTRLLDDVLSQQLRRLLLQIAHADDRSFRHQLRQRYEQLEAIRRKIVGQAPAQAAQGEIEGDIELDSSFH
jgi:hypothetical protein